MATWEQYWQNAVDFRTYLSEHGQKDVERWMLMYDLYHLTAAQRSILDTFRQPMRILTISGVWCGDCSAQVPLIQRIAEGNRLIKHRLLAIESMDGEFLERWQINGGRRVPMMFLLSADFRLGAFWGDRTLSRYRMLRDMKHEFNGDGLTQEAYYKQVACHSASQDMMRQTADELLGEIERAQIMFQLSPRLDRLTAPQPLPQAVVDKPPRKIEAGSNR